MKECQHTVRVQFDERYDQASISLSDEPRPSDHVIPFYDEGGLEINVDIDSSGRICGLEFPTDASRWLPVHMTKS